MEFEVFFNSIRTTLYSALLYFSTLPKNSRKLMPGNILLLGIQNKGHISCQKNLSSKPICPTSVLRIRITVMWIRILLVTSMRIRILLVTLTQIQILPFTLMRNLEKCRNRLIFHTIRLVIFKLIGSGSSLSLSCGYRSGSKNPT
jgi:hypothetical protein